MPTAANSFLFELDGTLVDSVYQHVLAWQSALEAEGIEQLGGAAIAGLA
jgi:beta-phosphoglucomutase-like phosphatase (HAD superfamily)